MGGFLGTNGFSFFSNGGPTIPSGIITGSGTTDYVAKFTSASTIGDSIIYASATAVGIGTASPQGLLHIDGGASATRLIIDADNNIAKILSFRTNAVPRWALRVDGNETGSNAASNLAVRAYNDAGTLLFTPMYIERATGYININTTTPSTYNLYVNGTEKVQTSLEIGDLLPATTKKIVYFGDSYTTGQGASSASTRYTTLVSNALGLTGVEQGLGGSTMIKAVPVDPFGTANAVDRVSTAIPTFDSTYEYLVIEYGLNDVRYNGANYTTAQFQTDYQFVIDTIIGKGWTADRLYLCSIPYLATYSSISGNPAANNTRNLAFGAIVQTLCTLNGCNYVELNQQQVVNGGALLIDSDNVHPNDSGYDVIAKCIKNVITYSIQSDGQELAVQGTSEFQSIIFPSTAAPVNSSSYSVLAISGTNEAVALPQNAVIRDSSQFAQGQGANIWVTGNVKSATITTTSKADLANMNIVGAYTAPTSYPATQFGLYTNYLTIQGFSGASAYTDMSLSPFGGKFFFGALADNGKGAKFQFTGCGQFTNGIVVNGVHTTSALDGLTMGFATNVGYIYNSNTTTYPLSLMFTGGNVLIGTASDDATNKLQVNGATKVTGAFETTTTIKTGAPSGAAGVWRLGQKIAASVALDTANYIEVLVDGVVYKLGIVV